LERQGNKEQARIMARAIKLAGKGKGWVNPNPLVGAVLVKDGQIIGEGYHSFFGGPHAEVQAISVATAPVNNSTLFVTLEPCIHQGKTPPCAPLILEKGITEVIVGMKDPNPLVNGKGIEYLVNHGIKVETGIMEKEIINQNEVFLKFIKTGLPFCVLKTAMTLDGKIATPTGESKWITGEESRKKVHDLRHQYSAVMAGINTILKDDPLLNARREGNKSRDPLKIIVDSAGRIPLTAKVLTHDPQLTILAVTSAAPKEKLTELERMGAHVILCPDKNKSVDLVFLTEMLGRMDVDSVLIEGGGTLAFSALREGIVDKFIGFIAPKILGGANAPTAVGGPGIGDLSQAITVDGMSIKKSGEDAYFEGYIGKPYPLSRSPRGEGGNKP
jgi:diaminohydroxyphosphoribosylaminopyrimidine deaminase / 5-amino-6-(5-phosphoribosylamino)uracil reductase